MSRRILLVPAHAHVGLSATSLGLAHALGERGVDVGYVKPLTQARHAGSTDHSGELFRLTTSLRPPDPVPAARVHELLSAGRIDQLMLEVLGTCEEVFGQHDVVILEGLAPGDDHVLPEHVNVELARALDAHVVLVGSARAQDPARLAAQLAAIAASYDSPTGSRVVGAIVNHIPVAGAEPIPGVPRWMADPEPLVAPFRTALLDKGLTLAAGILVHEEISRPRVSDLARSLGFEVLHEGDSSRRIGSVAIAAQSVPGFLSSLDADRLILVPGDRHEVLLSAALSEMTGVRLAAVVLTADVYPDPEVLDLCRPALDSGLPLLLSRAKTFETAARVLDLDPEIPADDEERARHVMRVMAASYDHQWLTALDGLAAQSRVTPAQFELSSRQAVGRGRYRVALADGASPANVAAAVAQFEADSVHCVLMASPADVARTAESIGLSVPAELPIVDPARGSERLAATLQALRGIGDEEAQEAVRDPLTAALLMLRLDDVDGVVGDGLHGDSPLLGLAEEIIGRRSDVATVSSCHFMLLPDGVVAYADCALNDEPSAADLACIAVQTSNTVEQIRITPRVALIAPSRSTPRADEALQRVQQAVAMIRDRRPDLLVDGPVPFEAAASVAKAAMLTPDSPLGGEATVFVFPDLPTANATYKAVRRSSGAHVVGPVLQGFAKSVNAPPRDATVAEVGDTIIATALQAGRSV